jgi:hypothetical protein
MNLVRAACTLSLVCLSCAAAAQGSGIRYGVAPAQDCTMGSTTPAKGEWVEASGVAVEGGPVRRMSVSFDEAIATDTIHVAMNEAGSRALALVETQDADGGWHQAWEGRLAAPAPNFSDVFCFEPQLPRKQLVQALRLTFRDAPGQIDVNHAALLRR